MHFGCTDAVAAATDRLVQAGFAVSLQPDDGEALALEASITAEVDRADEALAQALSGIDHDPVIEWHVGTLTAFLQPS